MENINYNEIADLLNKRNGNQNWTGEDVKTWFNSNYPEDFVDNNDVVQGICNSGGALDEEMSDSNSAYDWYERV